MKRSRTKNNSKQTIIEKMQATHYVPLFPFLDFGLGAGISCSFPLLTCSAMVTSVPTESPPSSSEPSLPSFFFAFFFLAACFLPGGDTPVCKQIYYIVIVLAGTYNYGL